MYSVAVAIGGAFGAVSRYWLVSLLSGAGAQRFPWGTFTVNVIGSLCIGMMYILISERLVLSEQWRAVLIVGYLGAFTTFSTFSLDALLLAQEGFILQSIAYVLASVLVCILSAYLGIALMRAL